MSVSLHSNKVFIMFYLKQNLPIWERAARITAGALITWAIVAGLAVGMVKWVAIASAATMVLTAFVGFCPACAMAGRRYLDQ